MRDGIPLDSIDDGAMQLRREPGKVEPRDLLFVDHMGADVDALWDLGMQVGALGEELCVERPQRVVPTHHGVALAILDHCVRAVAAHKALKVTSIERINLLLNDLNGIHCLSLFP